MNIATYINLLGSFILALILSILGSCSEDLSNIRTDDSFSDEEATVPGNVAGSFLTSCAAEFGTIGCTVKHVSSDTVLRPSDYGYEPQYAMYLTKNLFEDTPEELEKEGAFKIEGDSSPIGGSNATIAFSIIDPKFVIEGLYGDYRLSKDEKRDFNVGYQFTYDPADYNPDYPKKFARLDRCLLGVMMDSWLNDENSSFLEVDLTPAEFSKYTYLFTDDKIRDDRFLEYPIEDRPRKSIEFIVETYLDEKPANFEGEYTCRSDYEKFRAGEDNKLFKNFENEINDMVVDYLFNFKKENPPK